MTIYKRDFSAPQKSISLVLAIENTVANSSLLLATVKLLKARFNTQIALVFKAPELLFFNRGMLNMVSRGHIDRTLITDNPEYFWHDLIEFSKRQETDEIIIGNVADILSDTTEIIQLHVELQNACYLHYAHKDINLLAMSQTQLRKTNSIKANSFAEILASPPFNRDRYSQIDNSANSRSNALFITAQGLQRFGGLKEFLAKNIYIGGAKPNAYKRIWEIDNDMQIEDYLKQDINEINKALLVKIPGVLGNTQGRQVILDINPGATDKLGGYESEPLQLETPRMLLSITATNVASIAVSDAQVIFVMSNYNKARYIAGSLYSIVLQSHKNCSAIIIDDVSSDNSINVANEFSMLVDSNLFKLKITSNTTSRGTYWIRNSVIHDYINTKMFYLVNDSDDFSSSQRATIQLNKMSDMEMSDRICFGDIVRVDKEFSLLALDGKVERYGTASLGAFANIHKKYGYYENIRKNADTEFIERLRHFGGKSATHWFRYPILFQPFDGNNLTSDIYSMTSEGCASQNLSCRDLHRKTFSALHLSTEINQLPILYPLSETESMLRYSKIIPDFIIES